MPDFTENYYMESSNNPEVLEEEAKRVTEMISKGIAEDETSEREHSHFVFEEALCTLIENVDKFSMTAERYRVYAAKACSEY